MSMRLSSIRSVMTSKATPSTAVQTPTKETATVKPWKYDPARTRQIQLSRHAYLRIGQKLSWPNRIMSMKRRRKKSRRRRKRREKRSRSLPSKCHFHLMLHNPNLLQRTNQRRKRRRFLHHAKQRLQLPSLPLFLFLWPHQLQLKKKSNLKRKSEDSQLKQRNCLECQSRK